MLKPATVAMAPDSSNGIERYFFIRGCERKVRSDEQSQSARRDVIDDMARQFDLARKELAESGVTDAKYLANAYWSSCPGGG
jgi:hypothetical protein